MRKIVSVAACSFTMAGLLGVMPQAQAFQKGDWIVRGGATVVVPNESTHEKSGQLAPVLRGSSVHVSNDTQFGFTVAYMLTRHAGVELLGATPFKHDLTIHGGALDGTDLATAKDLPPTLGLQYHFDTGTALHPYVGVGVNYTYFFSEHVQSDARAAAVRKVSLSHSFGAAGQAGVDYMLGKHWMLNADVRYIQIDTTARIRTQTGTTHVDVNVDPWVYTAAIGYRF